jgi:hypothetical protein
MNESRFILAVIYVQGGKTMVHPEMMSGPNLKWLWIAGSMNNVVCRSMTIEARYAVSGFGSSPPWTLPQDTSLIERVENKSYSDLTGVMTSPTQCTM